MTTMRLTATDLVWEIKQLPKDRAYHYVYARTKTQIAIDDVVLPEGPISIKRWNPSKGERMDDAERESISTEMLARIANSFVEGQPVNFERVLGASYNTRSALEALLAHTPQFWACYPGRIDSYTGEIAEGHKHLIWSPNTIHKLGVIEWMDTDVVISEMPVLDASYDALSVPSDVLTGGVDINIKRRHTQIQMALLVIGRQLNYRTWIAKEDRGIIYNNRRIAELEGVVESLSKEPLIASFDGGIRAAESIDCIWFGNSKYMPAVMEVEHTTNIKTGLDRMIGLYGAIPAYETTRYVIVADDADRGEVVSKANLERFRPLKARYFPYSAVEELYVLCQRRKIRGIKQEFLDAYMEPVVST